MARANEPRTIARSLLVLGGTRSGKSAYAQRLAEAHGPNRLYLATAAAGDEEMAARIARHRADRGQGWNTLEEPLEIATALLTHTQLGRVVVVDCLTLWLSNLMRPAAIRALRSRLSPTRWVSRRSGDPRFQRVGMGIVPNHKLGREFRDWQGRAIGKSGPLASRDLHRSRAPAPIEAGCNPERAIGLKPRIFLNKPLATRGVAGLRFSRPWKGLSAAGAVGSHFKTFWLGSSAGSCVFSNATRRSRRRISTSRMTVRLIASR